MTETVNHEGHRERLRKRFISSPEQLNQQELLELLLTFSIPRKNVTHLAGELLERYPTVDAIVMAPFEELASVPGIGESSATLLILIGWIKMKKSSQQPSLFEIENQADITIELKQRSRRVFANDEIANALRVLPQAPLFDNLQAYKAYLVNNLPYNSEETRRRRANYILDRFFPGGLESPLMEFLKQVSGQETLKQVIFYHTIQSEPAAEKVLEDLVFPALPLGRLNRDQIKSFILQLLPETSASSLKNMVRSILNAYSILGVGSVSEDDVLNFHLHPGDPEAFVYVFFSVFPLPGIYTFDSLNQSPLHRWLLWDREWLRRQLYRLRDLGLLSKISEIDNVKQFSLEMTQAEALQKYFSQRQAAPSIVRDESEAGSYSDQEN